MSQFWTSVVWIFRDIINNFKFLEFKKGLQLQLSPVGKNRSCVLMQNARTCLYSNTTSVYFRVPPFYTSMAVYPGLNMQLQSISECHQILLFFIFDKSSSWRNEIFLSCFSEIKSLDVDLRDLFCEPSPVSFSFLFLVSPNVSSEAFRIFCACTDSFSTFHFFCSCCFVLQI